MDGEKLWKWFNERPQTPEEIKAWGEKVTRNKKLKFRFSFFGVRLLILGGIAQLVGTVAQWVILVRR